MKATASATTTAGGTAPPTPPGPTEGTAPKRPDAHGDAQTWKPLTLLNAYRFVLVAIFLALVIWDQPPTVIDRPHSMLFLGLALFYTGFALLNAFTLYTRQPAFPAQVYLQAGVDIAALTLIMHAAGGTASGFGMLLIITVAGTAILAGGRMAVLFAALAALAVLGEEVYSHYYHPDWPQAYTQAGILGVTFFVTALTVHWLARRLRETEALAAQRGLDLADMAQLNEYVVQHMQAGILVVDADERIRLFNESAWYLLGMPASDTYERLEEASPELTEALRTWRGGGEAPSSVRPPSTSTEVLVRFERLGTDATSGTLIFLEDATVATQQMQQMKLASLGRLTASIAHEIRNPLGAIGHAAQLLGEAPSLEANDARLTRIIHDHVGRMNEIIENILQLSRRRDSHPQLLTLGPWLEDFVNEFCQGEAIDPEEIAVDVQPTDLQARMDPSHLNQVLWNLCQNAVQHTTPPGSGTRLQLRASYGFESRGPTLEVIDYGSGIPPEVADQIFEPFFTTGAEGTGLGLYLARELCECNRARLDHVPVPSGGACFRITFAEPRSQVRSHDGLSSAHRG